MGGIVVRGGERDGGLGVKSGGRYAHRSAISQVCYIVGWRDCLVHAAIVFL